MPKPKKSSVDELATEYVILKWKTESGQLLTEHESWRRLELWNEITEFQGGRAAIDRASASLSLLSGD